jgi:hypothetical protein
MEAKLGLRIEAIGVHVLINKMQVAQTYVFGVFGNCTFRIPLIPSE